MLETVANLVAMGAGGAVVALTLLSFFLLRPLVQPDAQAVDNNTMKLIRQFIWVGFVSGVLVLSSAIVEAMSPPPEPPICEYYTTLSEENFVPFMLAKLSVECEEEE